MTAHFSRTQYSELLRKGGKRIKVETARITQGSFGLVTDARAEQDMASIVLPWPPAVNNLYVNVPGRGRVKSARYADWLDEAAGSIAEQKPGRIAGPYMVEIFATRPDNRRRDLDGICKPILDCLVKNRVTGDDHLAERIVLQWTRGGEGVRIVVTKAEGA